MAKAATISKMGAVRAALKELGKDAMPVKIQEYVKKTYGMEMSTAHVSNYKTYILKKKGKKAKRTKATASDSSAPAPAKASKGTAVSIQDVETVKELVGRVGEKNLKSLVDLVGWPEAIVITRGRHQFYDCRKV